MKIITEEKAYVQLQDISYLLKNLYKQETPTSIIDKCISNITKHIDNNKYRFLEFEEPDEIEFFKNLDYSIDYLELKDSSDEEIIEIATKIDNEKNEIVRKLNLMTEDEKQNRMTLVREYELLNFKISSIQDVIHIKKGESDIILPDAISYDIKKDEKGIQKWIKHLLKK